jgi:hypothetical protein
MSLVELVHPQGSRQVSVVPLITKCDLFKNNPGLAIAPYQVQSGVSLEDFRDFLSALEDKPININDRNFPGLSQLSEEFGFQVLSMKLSTHRRSPRLSSAQTAECLSRISVLEERTGQHEDQLAALQSALFPALQRFEADWRASPQNWRHSATQRTATLPSQRQPTFWRSKRTSLLSRESSSNRASVCLIR